MDRDDIGVILLFPSRPHGEPVEPRGRGTAHGEPDLVLRQAQDEVSPPHVASTNTAISSSVAASAAGLSQRIRLMRGKRSATPDLCRALGWAESNATSNTSSFLTSRTGPKAAIVL